MSFLGTRLCDLAMISHAVRTFPSIYLGRLNSTIAHTHVVWIRSMANVLLFFLTSHHFHNVNVTCTCVATRSCYMKLWIIKVRRVHRRVGTCKLPFLTPSLILFVVTQVARHFSFADFISLDIQNSLSSDYYRHRATILSENVTWRKFPRRNWRDILISLWQNTYLNFFLIYTAYRAIIRRTEMNIRYLILTVLVL